MLDPFHVYGGVKHLVKRPLAAFTDDCFLKRVELFLQPQPADLFPICRHSCVISPRSWDRGPQVLRPTGVYAYQTTPETHQKNSGILTPCADAMRCNVDCSGGARGLPGVRGGGARGGGARACGRDERH
eukprot:5229935-Pyramimonas_sp.AAC.1